MLEELIVCSGVEAALVLTAVVDTVSTGVENPVIDTKCFPYIIMKSSIW